VAGDMDETRHWRVGELARQAGLTVRTLHHWEERGLLAPSERTGAGYRLYSDEDVRRLYRIAALRDLGLSLGEIREALERDGGLRAVVERQLEALDRRMEHDARLRELLVRVLESHDSADLLATVEMIRMSDRYYTPEQQAELARRREQLGPEGMEQAQRDWAELIAAMEAEREAGTDPADPRVQELARRWSELIEAFTGGDPGIRASLQRMYEEQGPEQASRGALSAELAEYVARAQSQASR
jgi:MerR family transcriptional regulator, thiopeptide resistance regulator